MREIYAHVAKLIQIQLTAATFDELSMECWITVPAVWSDEARAATLEAVRNAGFVRKPSDEVFAISEPEAAAIATLNKYTKPGAINAVKVTNLRFS